LWSITQPLWGIIHLPMKHNTPIVSIMRPLESIMQPLRGIIHPLWGIMHHLATPVEHNIPRWT
jgi:hypothetical protein